MRTNDAATDARALYLVECYRPGASAASLWLAAGQLRAAAAALADEGAQVRLVGTTIVPTDEAVLCVFEAADEELVRDTFARAGVPCERLTPALSITESKEEIKQ